MHEDNLMTSGNIIKCESSFYSAPTCKLSKNFSNGNTSCIGKTVSSVRCDHMVCRLYGNFKPYTASLLLQIKSKFSNEEKHWVSTVSSVARSMVPLHEIKEKREKALIQEAALNTKGRLGPFFQNPELQLPWALYSNLSCLQPTKLDRRKMRSQKDPQANTSP